MEKYRLTVSEPWDYKNSAGDNFISGTIVRHIDHRCIVFRADESVSFGRDICGSILVLSSRFKTARDSQLSLPSTVNGGILLSDYDPDMADEELKCKAKFVLIGFLERVDSGN